MSDESAASSQEFSLPTVDGGLHDIGEKLPRDFQTGDGNFTVSIALPDGLSGIQPQLNLVYSSGTFGAGWNVNIPGVNRQTSKDIQHYEDANCHLHTFGAEGRIAVEQLSVVTAHRSRIEVWSLPFTAITIPIRIT